MSEEGLGIGWIVQLVLGPRFFGSPRIIPLSPSVSLLDENGEMINTCRVWVVLVLAAGAAETLDQDTVAIDRANEPETNAIAGATTADAADALDEPTAKVEPTALGDNATQQASSYPSRLGGSRPSKHPRANDVGPISNRRHPRPFHSQEVVADEAAIGAPGEATPQPDAPEGQGDGGESYGPSLFWLPILLVCYFVYRREGLSRLRRPLALGPLALIGPSAHRLIVYLLPRWLYSFVQSSDSSDTASENSSRTEPDSQAIDEVEGEGNVRLPLIEDSLTRIVPAAHGWDAEEPSLIGTEERKCLAHALPVTLSFSDWSIIYSTEMHGWSLQTFYRHLDQAGPSVLVVKDSAGAVFGGFASESWHQSAHYFGTGESFLFQLRPTLRIFPWSGENDHYMLGSGDSIAFGSGGAFGLWLDNCFETGSSGRCETYSNEPLASSPDFRVSSVEVWGFDSWLNSPRRGGKSRFSPNIVQMPSSDAPRRTFSFTPDAWSVGEGHAFNRKLP